MNKVYKWHGVYYSDTDLSEEIDNYQGDIFSLYFDMSQEGIIDEKTNYYLSSAEDGKTYESYEDLIANEFEHLEVWRNKDNEV